MSLKDHNKKQVYEYQLGDSQSDVFYVRITNDDLFLSEKLAKFPGSNFKFVCLNDNLQYSDPTSRELNQVVSEFYYSLFPKPSSFEK